VDQEDANVFTMKPRRATAVATAISLACGAGVATAAAWEYEPRVEVGAVYDDNYRLTDVPGQEIEVTGASLDAQIGFRNETPRTILQVTPRINSTYFPGESSEDSTDYFLTGSAERNSQRLRLRGEALFSDESVVASNLLAADFPGVDLGDTVSGDDGRVSIRNRRTLINLVPSLGFEWTERRRVIASAHFIDTSYDDDVFEQVGYSDIGALGGIEFDTSQRAVIALRASASVFSPDSSGPDTTRTGLDAEWRTRASETMRYYFRAGVTRSERDSIGTTPTISDTAFSGGVGVAWRWQVTDLVIDAVRSAGPSSSGSVVNRDELRFRVTRAMSPKMAGHLALRGVRTEGAVEDLLLVRDRKYAAATAGLEWRWSRQYALLGSYNYTWQEFEGEPADATSNGVTLSVVYEPRRSN
jgi:hypothetical protein